MKFAPGKTLGVVGGGQLGKMICMEARRMGYRIATLDPDPACPARTWSDQFILGAYDDVKALSSLVQVSDVVTLETEHVPAAILAAAAQGVPVFPSPQELRQLQDRLAQRRFLASKSIPQPKWAEVSKQIELEGAAQHTGTPAVFKTRTGGYDGKGQARVPSKEHLVQAWQSLDNRPVVLEAWVPFEAEVAATVVRAQDGSFRHYPLVRTVHRNGILHTAQVPANVPTNVEAAARRIAETIAAELGHVGVLCVEYFLLADGQLLVNEIAPRVHNSGHFTMGATTLSQFEAHARAVLGLAVAQPRLLGPVVMVNLLGDLWAQGAPNLVAVLDEARAKLHLYGKRDARPGRKMGHILVMDPDVETAMRLAEQLHAALSTRITEEVPL